MPATATINAEHTQTATAVDHIGSEVPTRPEEGASSPRSVATVVDLPNLNGHLRELAGGKRKASTRVAFDALARFAQTLGEPGADASCTVFMQLANGGEGERRFVAALRHLGIGVWPRLSGDIDDDLVAFVKQYRPLQRLMIVTHDRELIERAMIAAGTECEIVVGGFEEFSKTARENDSIRSIDLGDIPGFLSPKLERTRLSVLPDTGAYLGPIGRLGA